MGEPNLAIAFLAACWTEVSTEYASARVVTDSYAAILAYYIASPAATDVSQPQLQYHYLRLEIRWNPQTQK